MTVTAVSEVIEQPGASSGEPELHTVPWRRRTPNRAIRGHQARDIVLRLAVNACGAAAGGVLAFEAWSIGAWGILLASWVLAGHFLHTFALSLHDAAHGTLHPRRRVNEWLGHLYGTLVLVPLTVYRRAHAHHHAQLASIHDPELYPFTDPRTSRLFRWSWVVLELGAGYFVTPLLFVRSVLHDSRLTTALRRQIVREYAVCLALTATILLTVWLTQTWTFYFVAVLIPALIGGAFQTLRKYVEHLGLTGQTILHSTRSIRPQGSWNETVSWLLQHVDHHGTHHVRARVPFNDLPILSESLYAGRDGLPVYRSYWRAFLAMAGTLANPRVGAQWIVNDSERLRSRSRRQPVVTTAPADSVARIGPL